MTVEQGSTEQPSSPPTRPREFDPAHLGKRMPLDSGSSEESPAPAPREAPLPSSRSSHPPDAAELARVAAFGEPPSSVLGAVAYTLRVWRRRATLRGQLADAEALVELGQRDLDAALTRLGAALRSHAGSDVLKPLQDALAEADARESEAKADLARREATGGQSQDAIRDIELRLRNAREVARPVREREAQLAAREQDARRAVRQARAERPPADPDERVRADARRADQERQLAAVETELIAAREELAVALSEVADLEEEMRLLGRAGQRLDQRDRALRAEAVDAVEAALRGLGEEAVGRGVGADLSPFELKAAQSARSSLSARRREVLLHRQALEAYDRRAHSSGTLVLFGTLGALLTAVALIVMSR